MKTRKKQARKYNIIIVKKRESNQKNEEEIRNRTSMSLGISNGGNFHCLVYAQAGEWKWRSRR